MSELKKWGEDSWKTSTLSTGEEVGYLKEEGRFRAMFVVGAVQLMTGRLVPSEVEPFISQHRLNKKDTAKVRAGINKFKSYIMKGKRV